MNENSELRVGVGLPAPGMSRKTARNPFVNEYKMVNDRKIRFHTAGAFVYV